MPRRRPKFENVDIHALNDGRVVIIRPIRADDVVRLQAAHRRLSPLTRYRRFLTSTPYLSSADAAYLSVIDGCDHYALVATFAESPGADEAICFPASADPAQVDLLAEAVGL